MAWVHTQMHKQKHEHVARMSSMVGALVCKFNALAAQLHAPSRWLTWPRQLHVLEQTVLLNMLVFSLPPNLREAAAHQPDD